MTVKQVRKRIAEKLDAKKKLAPKSRAFKRGDDVVIVSGEFRNTKGRIIDIGINPRGVRAAVILHGGCYCRVEETTNLKRQ